MFLEFYGLKRQPFGVTPDPAYFYASPMHREALASLVCSIESNLGFSCLFGEPGTGKTTVLFSLLERYRRAAHVAFVVPRWQQWENLLRAIMTEFGLEVEVSDPFAQNEQFQSFLLKSAREGKPVIIIIDEAQNLSNDTLEAVRLMSNFETAQSKLLHIVLAGQRSLCDRLKSPQLTQLRQRITVASRLDELNASQVWEYIAHRLQIAGYNGPELFSQEAIDLLTVRSQGIPRNINAICFNSLSIGCALVQKNIDYDIVAEAANDREQLQPIRFGTFALEHRSEPLVRTSIEKNPTAIDISCPFKGSELDPSAKKAHPLRAELPPVGPPAEGVASESAMQQLPLAHEEVKARSLDRETGFQLLKGTPREGVSEAQMLSSEESEAEEPAQYSGKQSFWTSIFTERKFWATVLVCSLVGPGAAVLVPRMNSDTLLLSLPSKTDKISLPLIKVDTLSTSAPVQFSNTSESLESPSAAGSATPNQSTLRVPQPGERRSGEPSKIRAKVAKLIEPHVLDAPLTLPKDAPLSGAAGVVILKLMISAEGTLKTVEAESGQEPFVSSAMEAVRAWRFAPGRSNGRAVDMDLRVKIVYPGGAK
jgi:TonB family protein